MLNLVCALFLQDDWQKENFARPLDPHVLKSPRGHLELSRILGSRRGKHAGPVTCLSFHPDGKRVLSGSDDGSIRVWQVPSGREMARWRGHVAGVTCLAISADGKHAISGGSDAMVRVWDVESGKERAALDAGTWPATCIAINSDGTMAVSGGPDWKIRVWDLSAMKQSAAIEGHRDEVSAIGFLPDGARILSSSRDRTLRVWDLKRSAEIAKMEGHDKQVNTFQLYDEGTKAISGGEDGVCVWELSTFGLVHSVKKAGLFVQALAVDRQGAQLLVSDGSGLAHVDLKTGKSVELIEHARWGISAVALSADGAYAVSGGFDQQVSFWEIGRDNEPEPARQTVSASALHEDGTLAAAATMDRRVRVWETRTGRPIASLEFGWARALTFSADRLYAGGDKPLLREWKIDSWKKVRDYAHADFQIEALSQDGLRAVGRGKNNTLAFWDRESGTVSPIDGRATGSALSPDGRASILYGDKYLLCRSDRLAWDRRLDSIVVAAAIRPDGRHAVSATRDGTYQVWDVSTGRELMTWKSVSATIVRYSPDGRRLFAVGETAIVLWDVEENQEVDSIVTECPPASLSVSREWILVGNRDSTLSLYRWK